MLAEIPLRVAAEIVYRDFLAGGDVSQGVDGVTIERAVPVFLCVVGARVVDAAGVEEDPAGEAGGFDGEGISSDNSEGLFGEVLVWVEIVHGEEGGALRWGEGLDLLGQVRFEALFVRFVRGQGDGGSF